MSKQFGRSAECSCFDVSALMLGNLGHGPDEKIPTYRIEQVLCSLEIVLLHCVLVKPSSRIIDLPPSYPETVWRYAQIHDGSYFCQAVREKHHDSPSRALALA